MTPDELADLQRVTRQTYDLVRRIPSRYLLLSAFECLECEGQMHCSKRWCLPPSDGTT